LLDKTLVVITDDHGELLGAQGGPIGHGWLLTPELANAPLIIMDPQKPGYRVNQTIGSQVDLLPTVLDALGLPLPSKQLYQGRSLYASGVDESRCNYSNSYQQYGIIKENRLILGDRQTEAQPEGARKTYSISNVGAKTIFSACAAHPTNVSSIREFDKFQENFLRNYSFYCSLIAAERD